MSRRVQLTPPLSTASVKPCTYGTKSFRNWDIRSEWSFARALDEDAPPPPAFAARRAASPGSADKQSAERARARE